MYDSANAMIPAGVLDEVVLVRRPAAPPACWKPGIPGGMKCVAGTPPADRRGCCAAATRFDAAITALRALTLLNGGFCVLNAMKRLPPDGVSDSCFGYWVAAIFSASPVAGSRS